MFSQIAKVGSTIFITSKQKNDNIEFLKANDLNSFINGIVESIIISTDDLLRNENNNFLFINKNVVDLLDKINNGATF